MLELTINANDNPNGKSLADVFNHAGMVLIKRLMTKQQLEQACNGVNWAFEQPEERYQWIRQRSYEWHHTHPIFVEIIQHPLVLDFADIILEDKYHLIAAQCSRNTKADPYVPKAMKIHRDREFFPQENVKSPDIENHRYSFSAMWYLQDTPVTMGPTQLLPGSHRGESHFDDDELLESQLFSQAIPAGSLLIFSNNLWHRGGFNQVEQPRDLMTNVYARPIIPRDQLKTPSPNTDKLYSPEDVYIPYRDLQNIANDKLKMLLFS